MKTLSAWEADRPRFIFMLTVDDRTVADARERLAEALAAGVRDVGFKDVGLPWADLQGLADDIRAGGGESYLEVVSLDPDREIASARAALDLGVDHLLGGTHVDAVAPLLAREAVTYFPFPGRVVGHPSVLEGTVEEIVDSAMAIAATPGVDGLDLLAYRFGGDVPALMRAVCAAVEKPVIMAGSVDCAARVAAVAEAGAAAFTVGTAAFHGQFPAEADGLAGQIRSILALSAAPTADAVS